MITALATIVLSAAPAFELEWEAPASCPNRPDTISLVGDATGRAEVQLKEREGQWVVTIMFFAPMDGIRRVTVPTCEDAVRTAGLLVQLGSRGGFQQKPPSPVVVAETRRHGGLHDPGARRRFPAHGGLALVSIDVPSAYDQHVDFVWRLLLRLGVPTSSVEDAVQEAFLVHRRRSDFMGASTLQTWLGGIALRVAADMRRGQARALHHLEDLQRLPRLSPREPSQLVEEREAFTLVQSLLDQMSEEQRTVFVLAEFEELTLREIADITGVNANTVSSRLRLARQRFEALVGRSRTKEQAS